MPKSYIIEYLEAIESGKIVANQWITSMYKQLVPIIDGKDNEYIFNPKKGHKPIEFMERFCKQTKGRWRGHPLELMLFQKAKLEAVFGILNGDTNKRRFRQVFDLRARKNGKTVENAGTALYLLGPDNEGGPEIYSAATVKAQASLCFTEAKNMIKQSKILQTMYKAMTYDIKCEATSGFYTALGKNTSNFDGLNAHGIILDEVHELDRDIYEILLQSTSAREQWLMNMITTAGTKRAGLFDDLHPGMEKIAMGELESPTILPVLYQLDPGDDYRDEDVWQKANPGLDIIKSRQELRDRIQQIEIDPTLAAGVQVKDFNITGVKRNAWLTFDQYSNDHTFDLKAFNNKLVVIGVDLSKTNDLTAVNFGTWDKRNNEWLMHQMYWITQDFYNKHSTDNVPYKTWVSKGYIRISGEHAINYNDLTNYILTIKKKCNNMRLGWIYYDSYSAIYFIEDLKKTLHIDKDRMIPTQQGYKTISLPMQSLGSEFKAHRVNYQNNPVTKWCLSNTEADTDCNGNIKPKKYQDKRSMKIDGVAVMIDSFVGISEHLDNVKNY